MKAKPGTLWNENKCWCIVDEIGWKDLSGHREKSVNFRIKYPLYGSYMRKFSQHMRNKLNEAIDSYAKQSGECIPTVGRDSGWDLTAHIVGLGKRTFYETLKNPELAAMMYAQGDYIENFEYVFSIPSGENSFAEIQFKPEYLDA
ncbi:MAG: hypothetical protein P8J32_04045 [bacterium]|nr:hypothetical protein [bacterium]